jgi:hypothetical protein
MSIRTRAYEEMEAMGYEAEDIQTMDAILDLFFKRWDSGGAVWAVTPVLVRLLNSQPLSPLTGEDAEWEDVSHYGNGAIRYQNKRCSSVFKRQDGSAFDVDVPGRPVITFPYSPVTCFPPCPVF